VRVSSDGARSARWRPGLWSAAAWIGIVVAIGAVQIVREQWFDAAVLLCAALALSVAAATGAGRRTATLSARTAALCLGALGLAAALSPRHSLLMQLLVCAAGGVAILFAWPQRALPDRAWTPGQRRLAIRWALIVIAGCLWELGQFVAGRLHPERPAYALSDLLDPLMARVPGQAVFVIAWTALGAFLMLRGRR